MNNSTYRVTIRRTMIDGSKVGNGLKQGDGLELYHVKVKFTLQLATKAQRWGRGIALLFL